MRTIPILRDAQLKDKLEDRLHYLVCAGKVPLKDAQRDIAHDWIIISIVSFAAVFGLFVHIAHKHMDYTL